VTGFGLLKLTLRRRILLAKKIFNFASAFARWLKEFFTSSPSSANVCSNPSGTNSGS